MNCSECGKPLGADAVEGLCPQCLMKVGIGSQAAFNAGNEPAASFTAPTQEQLAPHFPQLEILHSLGRGGMGVVYKARQARLNRFVALKILVCDAERNPNFAQRFEQEAQT